MDFQAVRDFGRKWQGAIALVAKKEGFFFTYPVIVKGSNVQKKACLNYYNFKNASACAGFLFLILTSRPHVQFLTSEVIWA